MQIILGERVERPTTLDQELITAIKSSQPTSCGFAVVLGKTMCANDFYEGWYAIFTAYLEKPEPNFVTEVILRVVQGSELSPLILLALQTIFQSSLFQGV